MGPRHFTVIIDRPWVLGNRAIFSMRQGDAFNSLVVEPATFALLSVLLFYSWVRAALPFFDPGLRTAFGCSQHFLQASNVAQRGS